MLELPCDDRRVRTIMANSAPAMDTMALAQAVATVVGAISVAQGQGQNQPQVPQHPMPTANGSR